MLMTRELTYTGDFSLRASIGFLEGWPPSAGQTPPDTALRWACHLEGSWELAEVSVEQRDSEVIAAVDTTGPIEAATAQVSRTLGLDIDAAGFTADRIDDPVASALIAARPGLRPTAFWSAYEAAAWSVLSQRVSMVQASRLKQRIAETLGTDCHGLHAFPAPETMLAARSFDCVPAVKTDRLHAVARAALDGILDGATLRQLPTGEALARLQTVPGIGPFSAELILVRGAGHPDVFPVAEQRLHRIMRHRYDRPHATSADLARIADSWRPYRSWVSFLFRSTEG